MREETEKGKKGGTDRKWGGREKEKGGKGRKVGGGGQESTFIGLKAIQSPFFHRRGDLRP